MSEALPISGAQHAAVLMMLLDETLASGVLSRLEPGELTILGEKMCALGEIRPDEILSAINGFVSRTEKAGLPAQDRLGQVRGMMTRALGDLKADNLMQRIVPDERPTAIELARWLTPKALVPLIRGEHPQAIAVLLVQLEPETAAQVLASLPGDQQTPVIHRIATLGPVAPQALTMLEDMLSRRIGELHGQRALAMGGVREAAEIINASARSVEKRVMPEIAKLDKLLARSLEAEMFKFEHLFALDDKSMGTLLREVESDVLIGALKGIAEEQRDVFFRAMSSRAADGLKDEIEARGRMKMAEVIEAQKAIVGVARRLAAEGVIVFGASDDDYV
ncbi:MAG: flagellar motor switch protein FliG [Sphingomonadales bacterium]|nr:flagellar motor switch protein FliG [Sphingomonadales bacterium]MDE2569041.1 flagellar motor switch protein FliG [Sphingomonadales bacterium]